MIQKVSEPDDEKIVFLEEDNNSGFDASDYWNVLIADDDQAVHDATRYALGNTLIENRPIRFLHAHSASQARDILSQHADIAVILLDVVMEHEHSGLDLVRVIRSDLGLRALRIILRTGQPGHAPEAQVIRDYDINDYKLKSELTHTALVTTLTSAIRSYDLICTILSSRRGLSHIVDSSADLFSRRSLDQFTVGVVQRLAEMMEPSPENILICTKTSPPNTSAQWHWSVRVQYATGRFARWTGQRIDQIDNPEIYDAIQNCLDTRTNSYGRHSSTLFLSGDESRDAAVHFAHNRALSPIEKQLHDVFCVNVGVGLKNVSLIGDLRYLAYYDPLTGLLNRRGFIDAIDEHARQEKTDWTIALIDVDHFAEINDALGHQRGDALLTGITHRLQSEWGGDCVLGRVGSDVFGLLAPDNRIDPARTPEIFEEPIAVDGYLLPIEVTLGLTRLSEEKGSGLDLFKTTSIALKHAKREQRGRWLYHTHVMTVAARERLELTYKLRNAIAKHLGLAIHYQPQVELASGRVVGVEALLRWVTEDGQSIPPDRFITLAEYSGLMVNLGEWVFRTAATQIISWDAAGLPPVRLAINLSMMQFRDPRFVSKLRRIVDELKVPPNRLELEITESIAMLDTESVINSLREFKAMGMEVAVDDFGTGFSSLSYLHRLPIDRLKIDRSFVQSMTAKGDSGKTIADMVIKLAHSLQLSVVAEGVETEDQARLLHSMGCEYGQGYLYSPAMPPDKFVEWVKQQPS